MATIQLNNNDLRVMIREAVERLCEGQWYEAEPLCRLPYFVSVNFSDHAIAREDERDISQDRVIENLRQVIKQVIEDYSHQAFGPDDYIKVIDRENCVVTVCGINPSFNKKRIHQVVVVTCYVWDGRSNIDGGNVYYVNEESPAYLEAKKWNEENQDAVMDYKDWKHAISARKGIKDQRKKAETEYYWRNHPHEKSHEKRIRQLDYMYDRQAKKNKNDIHDLLPDGDLKAIQNHFKDMDKKKIELEPIYEMVSKAVKRAIRESLIRKMGERTRK